MPIDFQSSNLSDTDRLNSRYGVVDIEFLALGAITAGDAVALVPTDNTDGYMGTVEQLDVSDALPELIVGGALKTVATGQRVPVRVRGVQAGVNIATGVGAGSLTIGAADGRLALATAHQFKVAINLETAAANTSTVCWEDPQGFAQRH